jgi:hypothetical protein
VRFTTELLLLKQRIIFAFGTNSLLLQKITANADVMAVKRCKKIESSYERKICSFGFSFEFFFQRPKLSLSVNTTNNKMLNSSNIMSKTKGTGLCQQCWFLLQTTKAKKCTRNLEIFWVSLPRDKRHTCSCHFFVIVIKALCFLHCSLRRFF